MTGRDDSTNTQPRPIGDVLDALGIEAIIDPGELVAGAIVLLKVLQEDGETRLSLTYSDGLGWIERAGMLHVAEQLETTTGFTTTD